MLFDGRSKGLPSITLPDKTTETIKNMFVFVGKATNSNTVGNLTVVILRTYQALIILDARECLLVMPNSLYILCQNQNLQLIWRENLSSVISYKKSNSTLFLLLGLTKRMRTKLE